MLGFGVDKATVDELLAWSAQFMEWHISVTVFGFGWNIQIQTWNWIVLMDGIKSAIHKNKPIPIATLSMDLYPT